MRSLYLPIQILLGRVFLKEPSIWFVVLEASLRIISPRPRHSEQVCSTVSACCSILPRNLLEDLLDRAYEMFVALIFEICNIHEIVAYDCIHSTEVG